MFVSFREFVWGGCVAGREGGSAASRESRHTRRQGVPRGNGVQMTAFREHEGYRAAAAEVA
jgi:hypothetical protein